MTQALRIAALIAGACFVLLGFGIARNWIRFFPVHPIILAAAGLCWIAALWKWRVVPALIGLGSAIVSTGLVFFFVYPRVVDNGSGIDAGMLGMALGVGCGVIGLPLLFIGLILRAVQTKKSPTLS